MACNCENIDKNAVIQAAKQLLHQRVAERLQNIPCTHTNTDGIYSPSQYWYDLAKTDRRTVTTSMSAVWRANTCTIVISLNYS